MYGATYHCLHDWFKCEFEKLGWMVLAKNRGSMPGDKCDKVTMYVQGLGHLRDALKEKVDMTENVDNKKDLLILHAHTLELIEFVNKSSLVSQSGGARRKSKKTSKKSSRK
jgi:hypothetical protein